MEVRIFNRKPAERTVKNILKGAVAKLVPIKNDPRWVLFILNSGENNLGGINERNKAKG